MKKILLVLLCSAIGCSDFGFEAPVDQASKAFLGECSDDLNCNPCNLAHTSGNTLTELAGPRDMTGGVWNNAGFVEYSIQSTANSNGCTYIMYIRYNMVNQPAVGTVFQMVGGANGGSTREAYTYGKSFQNQLANRGIRTVEVEYRGGITADGSSWGGGSDVFPRNGWNNIASTYKDAYNWCLKQKIVEGFIVGYGNSGGSCMTANALVNQQIDFDGVILGGGPFGIVWPSPTGSLAEIEAYCFEDVGGIQNASPALQKCRGTINPSTKHPIDTHIAVLVGNTDPRFSFITQEAQLFLDLIKGKTESIAYPNAPHQILNTVQGRDAMLNIIDGWIN